MARPCLVWSGTAASCFPATLATYHADWNVCSTIADLDWNVKAIPAAILLPMCPGSSGRPRLTRKGAATRARIVDAAAQLIYQQGVAGTTIEEVRDCARVSSSQLYHYFDNKPALVRAVIERQADMAIGTQERFDLSSLDGLRKWRDFVVDHNRDTGGCGGLQTLGGQHHGRSSADARARPTRTRGRSATARAGLACRARGRPPARSDPARPRTARGRARRDDHAHRHPQQPHQHFARPLSPGTDDLPEAVPERV